MGKVQIIAEIGVNHNGDIELGKRLITAAAEAGADAVKTQLFVAEKLASAQARKAVYQRKTTGEADDNQLGMLKKLELSFAQYLTLNEHAKSIGVTLFAAPFDIESVRALVSISSPIIKIPSGEITNLPYLEEIARHNVKVYLSTGMSSMDEILAAVRVLKDSVSELTVLHCHTQYPTAFSDANLMAIDTIRRETGHPVGYSDHTPGIEAAIAAVALGATVIEKHFTLDKSLPGPDHQASLEPGEFALLVRSIRNVEEALGDGVKKMMPSEAENRAIARKSIVAVRPIRRGEIISEDMLAAKRPGDGISPMRWREVVGSVAQKDYEVDDFITCKI